MRHKYMQEVVKPIVIAQEAQWCLTEQACHQSWHPYGMADLADGPSTITELQPWGQMRLQHHFTPASLPPCPLCGAMATPDSAHLVGECERVARIAAELSSGWCHQPRSDWLVLLAQPRSLDEARCSAELLAAVYKALGH